MNIRSTYLTPLFRNYGAILEHLCETISKDLNSFDTIVFRGMSGAMIAPMVAYTLKKKFLLIRKNRITEERHHSFYNVEGTDEVNNYIIIDDGIDHGLTMNKILATMKIERPAAFCHKIYLYNQYDVNNNFRKDDYKKIPIVYT